jgi:hypothetical protein
VKKLYLSLIVLTFVTINAQAKRTSVISVEKAQTYEKALTGFGGRLTGSDSEAQAAAF